MGSVGVLEEELELEGGVAGGVAGSEVLGLAGGGLCLGLSFDLVSAGFVSVFVGSFGVSWGASAGGVTVGVGGGAGARVSAGVVGEEVSGGDVVCAGVGERGVL